MPSIKVLISHKNVKSEELYKALSQDKVTKYLDKIYGKKMLTKRFLKPFLS